jgi:hypothetical protein
MKTAKQFNLSKKRLIIFKNTRGNYGYYPEEDVKEFIRLLKDEVYNLEERKILDASMVSFKIDKLAGDKLNGN